MCCLVRRSHLKLKLHTHIHIIKHKHKHKQQTPYAARCPTCNKSYAAQGRLLALFIVRDQLLLMLSAEEKKWEGSGRHYAISRLMIGFRQLSDSGRVPINTVGILCPMLVTEIKVCKSCLSVSVAGQDHLLDRVSPGSSAHKIIHSCI